MKSRLFAACLGLLLFAVNAHRALADTPTEELPQCVVITHCVRVDWQVKDVEKAFKKTMQAIESTPRTKIVEKTESYLHAESTTKWMRYVDDLEVKSIPAKNVIQVRSESRVGIGDNGVNKKRIDDLEYRLSTNQLSN